MASLSGPMKKKKKPAFSKTKAVAAKAKGTASRVAERLNPFDAESKERRRQRKLTKTGKKAIARGERAKAGKRAKGTGLISTKTGRAKAIGVTADTQEEAEKIALERGVMCCSIVKDDLINSEYEIINSEIADT